MNLSGSGFSRRSRILMAPAGAVTKQFHGRVINSDYSYELLMTRLQLFRAHVYLQDGALSEADLTPDGRHASSADRQSWHLLTISADQRILGCARFHQHSSSVAYRQLGVRDASIADSAEWGSKLRSSIGAELERARQGGFSYVEMGGWALAKELRGTTEALQYVLATYAWTRLMGGALGVTMATERNGSASILRRLGGRSLQWQGESIPPYYDAHYNCGMELLRFDSRFPNPKYESSTQQLVGEMAKSVVLRREPRTSQAMLDIGMYLQDGVRCSDLSARIKGSVSDAPSGHRIR